MISPTDPQDRITAGRRRYTLAVLLAVFALNFMDRQILAILIQPIKQDLQLSDSALGLLSGFAFALFYTTLGIPIARRADRGNRSRIIAGALAVFSGMTALCGLAANFWQLALARMGVGVGEAGTNPASHSLIADLYPISARSTAMAIFALGPHLGLFLGFLVGGWVNQWYGWRVAFLAAGLPGLLAAGVVHFTLKEPPRGLSDGGSSTDRDPPRLGAVCRRMWARPSLRHILAGGALASFVAYGVISWLPAHLARSHRMESGTIGVVLALVVGLAGGVGTLLGGRLADHLARREPTWQVRLVALALVLGGLFWIAVFLAPDTKAMLWLLVLPGMLLGVYVGPTFALVQALADVRSRAVAAAVLLFVGNLVGVGLGPLAVGALSDLLRPRWGADALRFGLLIVVPVSLWAAYHYARAGRTLGADLGRARALHTREREAPGAPAAVPAPGGVR
jgi:MFS family permease